MKKANRNKLMYLAASILTLVVVPYGTYNVVSKQGVFKEETFQEAIHRQNAEYLKNNPPYRGPFDKDCVKKKIEDQHQKHGIVPYPFVEQSIASCKVNWDKFWELHDQEVMKNRRANRQ